MKIQFAYLAVLAAAVGVKAAVAYGPCIDLCYDVAATADCGTDYAPFWQPTEQCYYCCFSLPP
ncbi:hypothetical protein P692DRAFT_20836675 [Suillus brevipes Sb2]|jgi:hypothetical protein|nr:hypothetical protein P692DRAFT_20836675 [Suillus brevipes Sb2]